jgi:hypothetical protein
MSTEPLPETALVETKALSVSAHALRPNSTMGDAEVFFQTPPEHISRAFNGLRKGGGWLQSSTSTTTAQWDSTTNF